jgi:hypothetical protein
MTDPKLWNFQFGVEVSTRYHDWRRGTLEARVRFARLATLAGAILTLLTAFNPLSWAPHSVEWTVAGLAAVIAGINLWELVSNLGEAARTHTELYRRFMELQEQIAKHRDSWEAHLADWEAEAVTIRRDEPPTMWAVYAEAWNQTLDHYQLERKGYYRPVSFWQHMFKNVIQFRPQDFPAAA